MRQSRAWNMGQWLSRKNCRLSLSRSRSFGATTRLDVSVITDGEEEIIDSRANYSLESLPLQEYEVSADDKRSLGLQDGSMNSEPELNVYRPSDLEIDNGGSVSPTGQGTKGMEMKFSEYFRALSLENKPRYTEIGGEENDEAAMENGDGEDFCS